MTPDDPRVSVAGASAGGGAVVAGAVDLMREPACGIVDALDSMVDALNEHGREYAAERGLALDGRLPPFVALAVAGNRSEE
ncbi:DUF5987 family protein [Micromonospora sp. NPDC092111]|uniref:DUF5987 family protein n=1 Tax=Micromonospora sp. NPDC092111 TaxID=3364289 RepID=UPI0037FB0070